MTPAEHRAESERLLSQASHSRGPDDPRPCIPGGQPIGLRADLQYSHSQLVARAHVHALLALQPARLDSHYTV